MNRALAVVLLLPLVLLSSGAAPLRAAEPDDVLTDSAVTVSGRPGRYDDFSALKITVSQTRSLVNQGIEVSWTGGKETGPDANNVGRDFLQMMQCWGPDPAAATFRETCQWGGTIPPEGFPIGVRTTRREVGTGGGDERDPQETLPRGSKIVPFRAVTGETVPATDSGEGLKDFYRQDTTNEVSFARTATDGTGRFTFETQDSTRAPALGCGDPVAGSTTAGRACWLVIVPRGAHDALGRPSGNQGNLLSESPLTPTAFANRIVVPLEFQRVGSFCPLDGKKERQTVGSELLGEAIKSWQPALCANSGPIFGFSPSGDAEAGIYIRNPGLGAPSIGFVSEPVERQEEDPPIVHAPVALSAAVVAFTIDTRTDPGVPHPTAGKEVRDLKLTPRLLAKLLTQSYYQDVPGNAKNEHVNKNPQSIRHDKEFLDLNPLFATMARTTRPDGLMVVGGNSAMARQVWEYILADDEARAWLAGKPDDQGAGKPGMMVNPYYQELFTGGVAPDQFPKADPSCVPAPANSPGQPPLCTFDFRPYQGSFSAAARQTLRADTQQRVNWNPNPPPGAYKAADPQMVGRRFAISITDSASAARYGLATAGLRNRLGEFVEPTSYGILRGVDAMDPTRVDGVVRTNPKKQVRGAYPLSMLTYAAINLDQDQAARDDDVTFLRFAAGDGQTAGVEHGQLPAGYEALPNHLRRQTLAAAEAVEAGPPASPSPSPSATTDPPADSSGGDVGDVGDVDDDTGPTTDPTTDPDPTTAPDAGSRPSGGPVPGAGPPASPSGPAPRLVGQPTRGSDAGMFGDLLVVLLIAGALCAAAGPILLRVDRRRRNRSPG